MMKIYQATYEPYGNVNPYVYTLMDSINKQFGDVEWGTGLDIIWTDKVFSFDIVHIQWPDALTYQGCKANELRDRLIQMKERGVKLVTTCHNLVPHYDSNPENKKAYEICYALSDVILHLGMFSKRELEKTYPNAKHVLLYHHTYDHVYPKVLSKGDACRKLKLNPHNRYILCMGAFRDEEERELIRNVGSQFGFSRTYILAPSYIQLPHRDVKKDGLITYRRLYRIWMYLRYHLIITGNAFGAVSDEKLPAYYGAADIAVLQRKRILNSGNLPMAYMMGKVVVGPNQGNVEELLRETKNPIFNVEKPHSILFAIKQAFRLEKDGVGKKNKRYAAEKWSTDVVATTLHSCYLELVR